jgi:hypothetical protein
MADYLRYSNSGPSYRVLTIQDAIRKLGDYRYYDKYGNLIVFYPNIQMPSNLIGYEFAIATILENMKAKDNASFLNNTGFGVIENTSMPAFGQYYFEIEQLVHDGIEQRVSTRILQERQDIFDQFTKIKNVFDAYRAFVDDPDFVGSTFESWATTAVRDFSTNKTYMDFLAETAEQNEPVYSEDGNVRLSRGDVDYLKMVYALIPIYFVGRDTGLQAAIPRKSRTGIVDTELAIAGYKYDVMARVPGRDSRTLPIPQPTESNRSTTYSLVLKQFTSSTIKSGYQRWDPIILNRRVFAGTPEITEEYKTMLDPLDPNYDPQDTWVYKTNELDYGKHDTLVDSDKEWGVLREPTPGSAGQAGFVPQSIKRQNVRVWVVAGTQNITTTTTGTTTTTTTTTGTTDNTQRSNLSGRKFYLMVEEKPYDTTNPTAPPKIEVTDKKYSIPSSPSLLGTLFWCDDKGSQIQVGSAFSLGIGKLSYGVKSCFYPSKGTIFGYSYYYDIKDIVKNLDDFLGATVTPQSIYPGGIYLKEYISDALKAGTRIFAMDMTNICDNTMGESKGPVGSKLSLIRKSEDRYRIVSTNSVLTGTKPTWVADIESSAAMGMVEHAVKSAKYTFNEVITSPSDLAGEYWNPSLLEFEGVLKSKQIFGEIRDCTEAPIIVTGPCTSEANWEVFLEVDNASQDTSDLYIPNEIANLVTKLPTGTKSYQFIDNGILKPENRELYKKYVIDEQNRDTITNFIDIPQSRCLRGRQVQYNRFVRYDLKYVFSIRCNNGGTFIPIDYLGEAGRFGLANTNSSVFKSRKLWLREYLYGRALGPTGYTGPTKVIVHYNGSKIELAPGSFVDNADNVSGTDKALHTLLSNDASGMPFKYPLIDKNGNAGYFDYVEIQFNGNVECGSKRVSTEKKLDPTDSCGCTEFDEYTTTVSYDQNNPEFKYTHTSGEVTTVTVPQGDIKLGTTVGARVIKEDCIDPPVRIYHPFMYGKDVLTGVNKEMIKGLFNTSQSLSLYFTSSAQNTASKAYYYGITDCGNCTTAPYFSVAYGNNDGSGSINNGGEINDTPSRAVYSQYRLMAIEPPIKQFEFYDNGILTGSNEIYVINFNRNVLNDRIDPGNFEINLAELNGRSYANSVYTGSNVAVSSSNKILSLIDNSNDFSETEFCVESPYVYYHIVSGTLQNGVHSTGDGTEITNTRFTTYGLVYPNLGIIVLDAKKLNISASFNSVTGSGINGDNSYKLFTAISGASVLNKPMKARNVKKISTNHYFVRIPTNHANYTSNPTFTVDDGAEEGRIIYECFVDNPVTYITSVGLYNSARELLAIAKLSKPVKKTPQTDILIKIRLNW